MFVLPPLRLRMESQDVLVVEAPPSSYVADGLVVAGLTAVACGISWLRSAAGFAPIGPPPFEELVSAAGALGSLAMIVRAPLSSRRSIVRFDRASGTLVRARDGFSIPLQAIASIVLREVPRGRGLVSELVAIGTDGARILVLHPTVSTLRKSNVAAVAAVVDHVHAFLNAGHRNAYRAAPLLAGQLPPTTDSNRPR